MPRSRTDLEADVPCLTGKEYEIASPKTIAYNCFAWAHRETVGWLDPAESPGNYWPEGVPRARTLEAYVEAYGCFGFELCEDAQAEPGFEKIALYLDEYNEPSHATRLLLSGAWTSKLGGVEDIEHATPAILEGPDPGYGAVARYMRRRLP